MTPHFQMPEKFAMVEDKLHGVPLSQEYIDRKKRLQKYANWKGKGISYDARKLVSVGENGKPIDAMDLTEERKEPEILLSSVEEYSLAYYEQKLHWKASIPKLHYGIRSYLCSFSMFSFTTSSTG